MLADKVDYIRFLEPLGVSPRYLSLIDRTFDFELDFDSLFFSAEVIVDDIFFAVLTVLDLSREFGLGLSKFCTAPNFEMALGLVCKVLLFLSAATEGFVVLIAGAALTTGVASWNCSSMN